MRTGGGRPNSSVPEGTVSKSVSSLTVFCKLIWPPQWKSCKSIGTFSRRCLLIKSLIRFCAPKQALRMMAQVSVERSWGFQVAGAALVGLAGLIGYGVYTR